MFQQRPIQNPIKQKIKLFWKKVDDFQPLKFHLAYLIQPLDHWFEWSDKCESENSICFLPWITRISQISDLTNPEGNTGNIGKPSHMRLLTYWYFQETLPTYFLTYSNLCRCNGELRLPRFKTPPVLILLWIRTPPILIFRWNKTLSVN